MSDETIKIARRKPVDAVRVCTAVAKVQAEGGRVKDAAALLGMDPNALSTRLANLRKAGVKVPHFARGTDGGRLRLNIDSLNSIFSAAAAAAASAETE